MPPRRRSRVTGLVLSLLVALLGAPATAQKDKADPSSKSSAGTDDRGSRAQSPLTPCPAPSPTSDALCGAFVTPEDPSSPEGRTITLPVVVLPATSGSSASDALLFLAGGDVPPATVLAPLLARLVPRLREHRDIVLVDQRGSGGPSALRCPDAESLPPSVPPAEKSRLCLEELRDMADVRFYDTATAMDDLEGIRKWLGVGQWDLWGLSYGAKAARILLRRHPSSVRAAVLHAPLPLDGTLWRDMRANGQAVLDRLLTRCALDEACRSAWPRAATSLPTLLARFEHEPVVVDLDASPPSRPAPESVTLTRSDVGRALFELLRSTLSAGTIPSILDAASDGNFVPLARASRSASGSPPIPRGLELALVCSEEIARIPAGTESPPTLLDDGSSLREEREACEGWPTASLPKDFAVEPRSGAVPVLVLSGAEDPITPPRYGAAIAAALGNTRHLELPDRGHDDVDPCIADIVQDFLLTASSERLGLDCLRRPISDFKAASGTQ